MDAGAPVDGPADVAAAAHVYLERLDDRLEVGGEAGHHLERVRRLRTGETVTAADGYGRFRVYVVTATHPGAVTVEARSDVLHETPLLPRVVVALGLTKGEKPEVAVQKLTELGVDRVLLVRAARSVLRWDDERAGAAVERLRRVAAEAGAQCRRARLPPIEGPVEPGELGGHPGLVVADRDGVAAHELVAPWGGEWLVAVGPEGGWDPAELAAFGGAPRLAVGRQVLRAETAAIAVAAALAGRRWSRPADRGE